MAAKRSNLQIRKKTWTESELRLPIWMRGFPFPKEVADAVAEEYREDATPPHASHAMAMVRLSGIAEARLLAMRKKFDSDASAPNPRTFVHQVTFCLRNGRDFVLNLEGLPHPTVVYSRLDRLCNATDAVLNSLLSKPVAEILCEREDCKHGRRHFLPGPWVAAMEEAQAATIETVRLIGLRSETTAGITRNGTDQHRVSEQPDDGAWLAETDLARVGKVNQNTLRTHLRKWRLSHPGNNEWRGQLNKRPNDPGYLYRWGAVKVLIAILSKTGRKPANGKKLC